MRLKLNLCFWVFLSAETGIYTTLDLKGHSARKSPQPCNQWLEESYPKNEENYPNARETLAPESVQFKEK